MAIHRLCSYSFCQVAAEFSHRVLTSQNGRVRYRHGFHLDHAQRGSGIPFAHHFHKLQIHRFFRGGISLRDERLLRFDIPNEDHELSTVRLALVTLEFLLGL